MSICDEHGTDIAYTGLNCPACIHVEEVREDLKSEYDQEIVAMELDNDYLHGQIEDLKDKYGTKD